MLIDTRRRRWFGSAWFQNNNGIFTQFMLFGGSRRYSAINHCYSGGLLPLPWTQCGVFDHQTITHSLWPLSSTLLHPRDSTWCEPLPQLDYIATILFTFTIHLNLYLWLAGWWCWWWWRWLMSKHYKFHCQLLNHLSS